MTPTWKYGPTRPKSWISSGAVASLALLGGCLLVADADAGKKKRRKDDPIEVAPPEPEPPPSLPLWTAPLPISTGAVPEGLANLSSQGCSACHFDSHAQWTSSAHATGWRAPELLEAMRTSSEPACWNCHLPLIEQRAVLYADTDGRTETNAHTQNPAFDATLRAEGVTCVSCHLREGRIVTANPDLPEAPHPMAWSEDLSRSEGCAACHQLTWEGANTPLYDTYGEWRASPWSKAGVTCVDCHGGAQAGATGFTHQPHRGHGLSVLVDLEHLEIVRGDEPATVSVVLQNTGAGHAVPTGSPFTGLRVRVVLVGPPAPRSDAPTIVEAIRHDLVRQIDEAPPWNTLEDNRLQAGATKTVEGTIQLAHDAPLGAWEMQVQTWKLVRGETVGDPEVMQRLPLRVE